MATPTAKTEKTDKKIQPVQMRCVSPCIVKGFGYIAKGKIVEFSEAESTHPVVERNFVRIHGGDKEGDVLRRSSGLRDKPFDELQRIAQSYGIHASARVAKETLVAMIEDAIKDQLHSI